MQCPYCKIEAAIASSKYVLSTDSLKLFNEQKLFIEHEMKCRNPQCSYYNKIFATVRNELPVSKDSKET